MIFAQILPDGTATAQFFDPFSSFFALPAPTYAPRAVSRRAPRYGYRGGYARVWVPDRPRVQRARRAERVREASVPRRYAKRIRLASLPGSEPLPTRRTRVSPLERESEVKEKARSERKPEPSGREPAGDPVAALLNDKTLRRGDIVVLPDGAKVFKGGSSVPHRLSGFEDVNRTKLVGAKARRQLTATPIQPTAARPHTEVADRSPGNDTDERAAATGSLPGKHSLDGLGPAPPATSIGSPVDYET